MNKLPYKKSIFFALIILPVIIYNCGSLQKKEDLVVQSNTNLCGCYSSNVLDSLTIYFNNNVPGDLVAFNDQSNADCFAWQEFISLNWPTNATSSFGTPNDMNPVQWETYMPRDVLFQQNGAAPPAWGTLVSDKFVQKFKSQKLLFTNQKTKLLTFTSKFSQSDTLIGMDTGQAFPFNGPNWLGAQNGTNLWYEVMLNKDYYDFVVAKGYYNAVTQHDSVKANIPINFPEGVYNGKTGAIELKAAWMEVDNPQNAKWTRYKLSAATVLDPLTNKLRNTTVALVGLHILHKTSNQPTWVWATFEQIDNVPNAAGTLPPSGFNLNNANCTTQKVTYNPGNGDTTVVIGCTPNVPPGYYLNNAKPVPIQITRVNTIDTQNASIINAKMQNNIKQFYPNSVWQYYQLIDVIWSQNPKPNPTKPVQAPNVPTGMLSGSNIVANTTLESYIQNTTCYGCHQSSNIAALPADKVNNNVFGDFSFAIGFATYPTTGVKKKK